MVANLMLLSTVVLINVVFHQKTDVQGGIFITFTSITYCDSDLFEFSNGDWYWICFKHG